MLFMFILRCLFVVCVCGLLGGGRCATTRGAGAERAESIVTKTESIESKAKTGEKIVNSSHATPEEKKQLMELFNSMAQDSREIREPIRQLGDDTDHNKEIADNLQTVVASLKKYRTIFYSAMFGAVIFVFIWFKFIRT